MMSNAESNRVEDQMLNQNGLEDQHLFGRHLGFPILNFTNLTNGF